MHGLMTLLILSEFVLLQAVAVGVTTVIYSLIPGLDPGAQPTFEEWRRIFQVVGPTVTLSGGAGIVLSSIIFHWQAQKERQRAETIRIEAQAEVEAARAEARAAQATADERAQTIFAMRAELDRLHERLERLERNGGNSRSASA